MNYILNPLTLHPWARDSSEKWGEVPFLDKESISHVICGFFKDKAAVPFMPTLSRGDLSHQWSVSYRIVRGHVTWEPAKASFRETTNARKTCFLWHACQMRRKWGLYCQILCVIKKWLFWNACSCVSCQGLCRVMVALLGQCCPLPSSAGWFQAG